MRFKFFYLCLAFLFLTSCATWHRYRNPEYIRLKSNAQGAEVFRYGERLGGTPTLIKAKHGPHDDLTVWNGSESENFRLEGHYDWNKSFWGNLWFLTLAPVGWVVDLASGSAWKYDSDVEIKFDHPKKGSENKRPMFLAIAPPKTIHEDVADEIGPHLQEDIQNKHPNYKIIPYKQTISTFEDFGFDFDGDGDGRQQLDFLGHMHADAMVTSDVNLSKNPIEVNYKIHDILGRVPDENGTMSLGQEHLPRLKEIGWVGSNTDFLYWLPNSLLLDSSNSRTSLQIINQTYEASASNTDGFIGAMSSVFSAVTLRHMRHPSNRDEWRYHLRFVPTASFSYANEKFTTLPSISDVTFTRAHCDFGWGASFNYENSNSVYYFNFIPVVTYDSIKSRYSSISDLNLTTSTEIGYVYFLSSKWVMRFYSRNVTVRTDLWQKSISPAIGSNTDIQSSNFIQSGVSFGYVFPNQELPYR